MHAFLNAAHDGDAKGVREIKGEYADGLRAAAPEAARISVRVIAELLRDGADVGARGDGHVLRERGFAEHDGDGGDGEAGSAGDVEERDMAGLSLTHLAPSRPNPFRPDLPIFA